MSNTNKGITANKWPIVWPPTRWSLNLLFRAINLKVSPTRLIDALIYSRGPKMDEEPAENFNMDKLIQWFLLNLKTIKHIDYKLADPEWLAVSPNALTLTVEKSRDTTFMSPQ
jgi:hypothetical protein